MATYPFDIEGTSCDHWIRAVKNALEDVQGVKAASVRIGHAEVATEDGTARDALVTAIEEEGYRVIGR